MKFSPLEPNKIYHIFNHATHNCNLFRTENNFDFFIEKYNIYINNIADIYAYCLMPNHFHFLLKIKNIEQILSFDNDVKNDKKKSSDPLGRVGTLIAENKLTNSQQFKKAKKIISNTLKNFFVSYTNSYNKVFNRRGNLFIQKFNRLHISSEQYFMNCMQYIHLNPVEHNFVKQPEDWKYSSYTTFYSDKPTKIKREIALKLFGNINNFEHFHKNNNYKKYALEMNLAY